MAPSDSAKFIAFLCKKNRRATVRVEIVNGVKGVRSLIDSYTLAAMKVFYPQWETVGIELLERCVTKDGLTDVGREIWQSMVNDMGATVAGGSHA
ncbi:hypothetical protein ACM2UU_16470 [Escherichia coli]